MSKRDPKLLVTDMIDSGEKIIRYCKGLTYELFLDDDKTIDAVIRNFEIIGEAANRLPDEFKDQYPDVDWHKIRGFRNRIVHDYMGIDYSIVWEIKTEFLPALLTLLQPISR
ncbi:HepT-like ribonuclease domain-containing protein [Fibrella aquatica]|jgi:uncharacterized protein with HEPN domain|uniref:HepT-like ribonuclease domain-containing protein n=1 Tax=Fibrella aquatica TaxID=3242487 RepID=UPI0035225ACA